MTHRFSLVLLGMVLALCIPQAWGGESMQAIRMTEFGGVEVLDIASMPRPVPASGELLIRVHAAAVNPVDAHIRRGYAAGFIDVEMPYVPGFDVSGVVAAVGEGIDGFAVGDPIFAMLDLNRGGAYAEYAIVKAGEAARKPESIGHVEAAALPLVTLTAWQALFDTAQLVSGQTVLIHGGSGGVGSVAIQLAKERGARVITTASLGNHDFARSLGADVVVDYRSERFEDVAKDVDVVLDTVGGPTQERSLQVLKNGGVLVSLVGLGESARTPPRDIRAIGILVRPDAAQLGMIAALVDRGQLKPEVSMVLPVEQVDEAHRQIETGHTRGKVVLQILK
ncbi:MAG TPA: NADP-dependent oxidoreductase [Xanthomonadaceae bacterium]|nr:NADP-dependent oxidoreductase [Xanthomonadaceae bacterium]